MLLDATCSSVHLQYSGIAISHESLPAGTIALETQLTISVDVTNNGEYSLPHDEVVMAFAKPSLRDEPTPEMSGVHHASHSLARIYCASTYLLYLLPPDCILNLSSVFHSATTDVGWFHTHHHEAWRDHHCDG